VPVFNAARNAALATVGFVSLTIVACGSGGAASTPAPTSPSLSASSAPAAEAAIRRGSGPEQVPHAAPGEFRLGPGNLQPPGVVIPLAGGSRAPGPVRGEFRLGPGNQQPPGVVIPLD
jgi:hypothetical protein